MPALSLSLFDAADPAYYRGATARTKATSASGAVAALTDRKKKIDAVRRAWAKPRTIQDVAAITGFAIGSVCSLKKCIERELVEVGEVEKLWADGRVTNLTGIGEMRQAKSGRIKGRTAGNRLFNINAHRRCDVMPSPFPTLYAFGFALLAPVVR